jgi:hypothetical protein
MEASRLEYTSALSISTSFKHFEKVLPENGILDSLLGLEEM